MTRVHFTLCQKEAFGLYFSSSPSVPPSVFPPLHTQMPVKCVNICNLDRAYFHPDWCPHVSQDIEHDIFCIVFSSTPHFVFAPLHEDHAAIFPSLFSWSYFFPFLQRKWRAKGWESWEGMKKGRDRATISEIVARSSNNPGNVSIFIRLINSFDDILDVCMTSIVFEWPTSVYYSLAYHKCTV